MSKAVKGNMGKICNVIEQNTGAPAKVIAVPSELIHFVGNTQKAVFLAQLVYWSDKATRKDGYVFKSRREWETETGLSSNQIERYTKEFKKKKFLNTKKLKAYGS